MIFTVPGDPQKSVKVLIELNFVLRPKSHNFRSTHFPCSLSNVKRMFSGFKSEKKKRIETNELDVITIYFCNYFKYQDRIK